MAGGAFNARPYENQFKGHFEQNFSHNLDWGTKIPFCILLASPAETCVLYQKIEKVIKTTQNVLKTVDNHW